jgi:hypothetical protein
MRITQRDEISRLALFLPSSKEYLDRLIDLIRILLGALQQAKGRANMPDK